MMGPRVIQAAPAASDRLAPKRSVRRPEPQAHPRPAAEIAYGGEVSWCYLLECVTLVDQAQAIPTMALYAAIDRGAVASLYLLPSQRCANFR